MSKVFGMVRTPKYERDMCAMIKERHTKEPIRFLLWDEVAERAFKCCVIKQRGAVMSASAFAFAMELYCINVMKLYPPYFPWEHVPTEEERYFTRFFRKQGLSPGRIYLPDIGVSYWKGVYVRIPEKWYHVDTKNLKREVIKWQISENGVKAQASRSFE
ncbi:MAG: hypothetical protein RRY12_01445 [Cloacibacillus sp.]